MRKLTTDYLVVGSGAMGMAFTDVLLTETDAKILIADKNHQPGGHWNHAYPFVRLHQPSAFYGVNSMKLGNNTVDATGLNKGLYELATNGEVCSYFDQVMQRRFLPSGRVLYFPSCEYQGDGEFVSLISGEKYSVSFSKEVDSTYMNVVVPAMRKPPFVVNGNAKCIPPNDLPGSCEKYDRFVVIGGGKTAIDATLFLLKNEVKPENVVWIMPRDSWILDRANLQPTFESIGRFFLEQMIQGSKSETIEDFIDRMSEAGGLLRIDENVRPTMYRCSTVSNAELQQLRRVKNIVRKGRVEVLDQDEIRLEEGSISTSLDALHIDCTADGLAKRSPVPIFQDSKITLQSVRTCQQVFSAALIAHIEATYLEDEEKNSFCRPVPHPDTDIDFLRNSVGDWVNLSIWSKEPKLKKWIQNCRLDPSSHVIKSSRLGKLINMINNIIPLPSARRINAIQAQAVKNIEKLLKLHDS